MLAIPGLREGLAKAYGARLRGVFLFGSRSRADAEAESDLDVLVVLDRVDSYAEELERTSELTARLSLAYGFAISRVFVAEADWQRAGTPFLSGIRADAVPA
ncbi:MAG: nucleotidyltransferase domain-containing protein [Deltaproteobacteria bacterium]|nr:nucleotidyltransferase domain-containing protein [Deltaproteobacteria bacterium]